jgi:hypothetical protein
VEDTIESKKVRIDSLEGNFSPDAFHIYAVHYYKCKQDFKRPDDFFSPVPYFLLCRAIELEIKSRHLKDKSQKKVKDEYRHRLLQAYNALDQNERILTPHEVKVLEAAGDIYARKGFEYFEPYDGMTGFSRYPDLKTLDSVAKKLIAL